MFCVDHSQRCRLVICFADTLKDGVSAVGSAVGGAAGKVVDVTKSAVVATGEGISTVAHKAGETVGRASSL